MRWTALLLIALVMSIAAWPRAFSPADAATTPPARPATKHEAVPARTSDPVRVSFRNVHLHVAPGVIAEIRRLEGAMIGNAGQPPSFDDQRSYVLRVDSGEVAMTPASLSRLLNDYVFAYANAPISNIDVSIESGHLKQKGTLHKGIAVPFTMTADVSATADGRIRLHPTELKTAGLPARGVMKVFGIKLDDLVKSNAAHGFEVRDNEMMLSAERLLPAPALKGHLTAARIEGDRIVEVFGNGNTTASSGGTGNYMRYRGGTLKFGKLTMTDADIDLIDADPRDPFDFSQPDYVKQLVAGYSKNTPSGGLRVYMPDFNDAASTDLRPTATSGR